MPPISPTPNAQIGASYLEATHVFRALQYAVAQCRDAVFITDAAGTISHINPAFEKLTGYSSHEAIGKDLSVLTADGPYSEDYRHVWEKVLQQRAFRGPITLMHKSGRRLLVELTITPVSDPPGQVGTLVCTCTANEQAASPNRFSAEPAAATPCQVKEVAHALNNRLMIVLAEAELSFESLPFEHPARVRLKGIQDTCRRAAELVCLLYELEGQSPKPTRPEPLHYQSSSPNSTIQPVSHKTRAKAAS